jgi:hypothetical protein
VEEPFGDTTQGCPSGKEQVKTVNSNSAHDLSGMTKKQWASTWEGTVVLNKKSRLNLKQIL